MWGLKNWDANDFVKESHTFPFFTLLICPGMDAQQINIALFNIELYRERKTRYEYIYITPPILCLSVCPCSMPKRTYLNLNIPKMRMRISEFHYLIRKCTSTFLWISNKTSCLMENCSAGGFQHSNSTIFWEKSGFENGYKVSMYFKHIYLNHILYLESCWW